MRKSNGKTSKFGRRSFAVALSMAMVVSSLTVASTDADAKAKGAVKSVKVTSPVVNGGKLVLKKGQKQQIKYAVTVTKGASKKVTVTSSNTKVNSIIVQGKAVSVPFIARVSVSDLNYRSRPSMKGKVLGQTGKGSFTIVEVSNGWGKLKSGAGWIYLENPKYCTI